MIHFDFLKNKTKLIEQIESIVKNNSILNTKEIKRFITNLKKCAEGKNEDIIKIVNDKDFTNILVLHICLNENNIGVDYFKEKYIPFIAKTDSCNIFNINDCCNIFNVNNINNCSDEDIKDFIDYLAYVKDVVSFLELNEESAEQFKEKYKESERVILDSLKTMEFISSKNSYCDSDSDTEKEEEGGGFMDGVLTFLKYAVPVAIGAGVGYYIGSNFVSEDAVEKWIDSETGN